MTGFVGVILANVAADLVNHLVQTAAGRPRGLALSAAALLPARPLS